MQKQFTNEDFFEENRFLLADLQEGIALYEVIYSPDQSRQLKLIDCTHKVCSQSGFDRDELLAMPNVLDHMHPIVMPDALVTPEVFDAVVRYTPSFEGFFKWKRPDNKPKWIQYSAKLSQKGDKFYLLGIYHDITDENGNPK